jgi:glycerate 2-kinase
MPGAFVDSEVWNTATTLGLVPETFIENNDSHGFFAEVNAQLRTGSTGTNVMDILIVVRGPT